MSLKQEIKHKDVVLNQAQVMAYIAYKLGKKFFFFKMGRGAGKSTILAWFIIQCVRQMPRSTGVLVGETYLQILSKTFQSTKEGLAMFGWIQGIHYVVGKDGAKLGFKRPFQAPDDWRKVIHFRNGTIMIMVSMDMENSGRGLNSYWVIGDEAALLDPQRLFDNVQTTNRSVKTEFRNASLLNAEIFASSVPMTRKGKWFNEAEKESLLPENTKTHAYIKANAYVNKMNLTREWFDRMRRKAISDMHYEAEIENIDPPAVLNAFYMFFDEDVHCYGNGYNMAYLEGVNVDYDVKQHYNCLQDKDLTSTVALEISIDPGTVINSMTVWQYLRSIHEERCLKEFFVKRPLDYEDLLVEFDDYYQSHKERNNTVYLRHDAQAYKERDKRKNNELVFRLIEKKLRELGWRVIQKTPKTNNPYHNEKFTILNALLKGNQNHIPKVRVNKDNCPNLVISIQNAETEVKKKNEFGKDKSSEQSSNTLPEHATHLSDTFDYHLYWKWAETVRGSTSNFFMQIN